jgi:predicted amidohydrolase YtcJ
LPTQFVVIWQRSAKWEEEKMASGLILLDGNIYTMNPAQPHATALAIRGGRISYVGDDAAAARAAGGAGAITMRLAGG